MNSETVNSQLSAVMQRRSELLTRIAAQRGQIAEIGARLQTPLRLADRGVAAARFLRANPVLAAGVAAVFIMRRRGVAGLMRVVWRVWRKYRYFTAIASKFSQ